MQLNSLSLSISSMVSKRCILSFTIHQVHDLYKSGLTGLLVTRVPATSLKSISGHGLKRSHMQLEIGFIKIVKKSWRADLAHTNNDYT